jgi:23S rRNA pseudouridine1911/1915/1917 synthase
MTEIYRFDGKTTSNEIKIIYEDNHIISVVKPAGILSQGDASQDTDLLSLLKQDLKTRYNKPYDAFVGLVHRLDRNTGGTMVYAKTSKGASRLSKQLRDKEFKKGYFAIVDGIVKKDGRLTNKLEKDSKTNKVYESDEGKLSILEYKVIDCIGDMSLVFVIPITGRTHQIRAQMAFFGHPLIGDVKYGYKKNMGDFFALWSSCIKIKHVTLDKKLLLQSIPERSNVWSKFKEKTYIDALNEIGDVL